MSRGLLDNGVSLDGPALVGCDPTLEVGWNVAFVGEFGPLTGSFDPLETCGPDCDRFGPAR